MPRIGRFDILSELGRGYHGRVFLAWDPTLERKVAIKAVLGRGNQTDEFMTEVRAVARLAHPNIIPLFEIGTHAGTPFLVFEYVEGRLLRDELVRVSPLPEARALAWMFQVLEGMALAHAEGIAHLDLSPANLMVDARGNLRVMDFGLARLSAAEESDATTLARGTPRYMSPEHFAGKALDQRTDVFALGLILFELLAGGPAAEGEGLPAVRALITSCQFGWGRLERAGVSNGVIQVLREALAPRPEARFATAGEMLEALRQACEASAEPTAQVLAVRFLLRRLQRRPEFPAFSNSLHELNRLTAENSTAALDDLAAVVQRDFSLTNRLMKIANSAFFNRRPGGVSTLSHAITLVGTRVVRLLCNGLLVFDLLNDGRSELEDALVGAFVAALMARTLGTTQRRELAEEAFICALFHRLGRNLVIYYLSDEHREIEERVAGGEARLAAERQILGTSSASLGAAVARHWKFPDAIVDSMGDSPPDAGHEPQEGTAVTRWLWAAARITTVLCETGQTATLDTTGRWAALELLAERAGPFGLDTTQLCELLAGALDSFVELAPALGVNVATSGFCQRTGVFLTEIKTHLDAVRDEDGD